MVQKATRRGKLSGKQQGKKPRMKGSHHHPVLINLMPMELCHFTAAEKLGLRACVCVCVQQEGGGGGHLKRAVKTGMLRVKKWKEECTYLFSKRRYAPEPTCTVLHV